MDSLYIQTKKIILPYLEAYKTDLLVHDKKALRTASEFIIAYRKTGTHIIVIKDIKKESIPLPDNGSGNLFNGPWTFGRNDIISIIDHNEKYLYGSKDTVMHLDKKGVLEIIRSMDSYAFVSL